MASESADVQHWQVAIIGAGAAGLFAAGTAAARGRKTLVLEKNVKLGVKILMSGGTRCNITHDVDWQGIADAYGGSQGRFLKFALASLTPDMVVNFFEQLNVPTKIESTGKVFPLSDRAIDVRNALVKFATDAGASIRNQSHVTDIEKLENGFRITCGQDVFTADSIIVTTGGQSYPGCGTIGEGYQWLSRMGHSIVEPRPALAPVRLENEWVKDLKGITLPDVAISVVGRNGEKTDNIRTSDRGSFLFTHFGASGPIAMNVSRTITNPLNNFSKSLQCDWLPDVSEQELATRIRMGKESSGNQTIVNWLLGTLIELSAEPLPRRVIESLCVVAQCDVQVRLAELSKKRMNDLIKSLKACRLDIDGTLGFKKAEVTAGGVALDEVNSKTMQSKIVPGLFLAGEILDVDGPIGGYNFQAAFSTGNIAGLNA